MITPSRPGWAGSTWLLALAFLAARAPVAAAQGAAQRIPRTVTAFRVCADPNNLPFSNDKGEGFENKIAELVAHDLGLPLRYTWRPQRRGFVRTTLNAGACDVVMGVPSTYDLVRTARPYYRSTYVFVYRKDRDYHITSIADTVLRRLKIGMHVIGDDYHNPPPAEALAALGIIDNVEGYPIYGDYSQPNPPARLIDAVAKGDVDVAIVWGPLAGYSAKRQSVPLAIVPVPAASDITGQQWTFAISMGVRHRDQGLAALLDSLLDADRTAIRAILTDYGVPLVEAGVERAAPGAAPDSGHP
jgi:mxaJ protein